METVSQRLVDMTDRLDKVLDGAKLDIAVQKERLDNQDKLIEEIRDAAKAHQESDQLAHKAMNEKLDAIGSKIDGLVGADSVRAARQIKDDNATLTFSEKLSQYLSNWKYAIWGAVFTAGVFTHKAHFFEWLLRTVAGN